MKPTSYECPRTVLSTLIPVIAWCPMASPIWRKLSTMSLVPWMLSDIIGEETQPARSHKWVTHLRKTGIISYSTSFLTISFLRVASGFVLTIVQSLWHSTDLSTKSLLKSLLISKQFHNYITHSHGCLEPSLRQNYRLTVCPLYFDEHNSMKLQ